MEAGLCGCACGILANMKLKVQATSERSDVFDCPTWDDAVEHLKTWLMDNHVSAADFISANVYSDAGTQIMGTITFTGLVQYAVKKQRYRPVK